MTIDEIRACGNALDKLAEAQREKFRQILIAWVERGFNGSVMKCKGKGKKGKGRK